MSTKVVDSVTLDDDTGHVTIELNLDALAEERGNTGMPFHLLRVRADGISQGSTDLYLLLGASRDGLNYVQLTAAPGKTHSQPKNQVHINLTRKNFRPDR